ncbi:unnamed protein product [Rhizophagus irregularis]|nr:unnamed protein product [Rhizophagus irregularis]
MSAVVLSHDAAKYSIHEHENFFWKFRMMNIYDVVALDHMHLQEIGLFPYMLDFTREMIMYQSGNQIITKMDVRLATITPFSGLRILRNGYQQGAKFTGAEMRDVMKIIIFVLDELYTNNDIIRHRNDTENTSHEFVDCKKLIQCFIKFVKMYITSRKENFNEDELNEFEQEIIRWSDDFVKLFKTFSRSELRLPKLHMWRYHTIQTIKRYGAINGLTTETYETLHKNWVKNQYRISNKKNVLDQIIKTIRRQIITTNELKKPTMLKLDYAFLDEKSNISENDDINLKIYASGILTNGEIVYATSRFYGRPKFSDIAIAMDDADYLTDNGICYGKILMLAEIILSSSTLPIALIHWYDYYSKRYPKNGKIFSSWEECDSFFDGWSKKNGFHIKKDRVLRKEGNIRRQTYLCVHSGSYESKSKKDTSTKKTKYLFLVNVSYPKTKNPSSNVVINKLINKHNHSLSVEMITFEEQKKFTTEMMEDIKFLTSHCKFGATAQRKFLEGKYPSQPIYSKDLYAVTGTCHILIDEILTFIIIYPYLV